MRYLVIYAHPDHNSFHAAIHECVVATLSASGHEVDDCDLYTEGFQPVLSWEERQAYYDVGRNRAAVLSEIERLERSQGLIFVFPTWWYGMPAILKGYVDRVWVPGFAFELSGSTSSCWETPIAKCSCVEFGTCSLPTRGPCGSLCTVWTPSEKMSERDFLNGSAPAYKDSLRAQGDLTGALAAYRESLAIRRDLSAKDPSNTGWRRDVSWSLNNVGNLLRAQGDLAGALAAYRESLDIVRDLSAKDSSNTGWRRDLSVA